MSLFAWFRAIAWPGWLTKLAAALIGVLTLRYIWRKQGADAQTAKQNAARLKGIAASKKDLDDAQTLTDQQLADRLTRTPRGRVPSDDR